MAAGNSPGGVSVIIATTMRHETVTPVVEAALAAVSDQGGEVIVVVNGPTEGRRHLGVSSRSLKVVECRVPRTAAARNMGVAEASNDVAEDDDAIALRMREDGIAFRDGMQTMETIALGGVTEG